MITTIRCSIFACLLLSSCGSDQSPDAGKKVVRLDLLGIMHEDFPCEKYLEEMKDATEINIGWLDGGTFGSSRDCLNQIQGYPQLASIRVHVCNGSCITNGRCQPSECRVKPTWDAEFDVGEFEWWARATLESLSNGNPRVRTYISPVLEHQLDRATFDRAAELLLRLAKEYGLEIEIVDNPLYPRESSYLLEVHNEFDPVQMPYLYSTDGYMFDPRVLLSLNQDALIAFEWRPSMNGICTDGSEWVSPLERKCF